MYAVPVPVSPLVSLCSICHVPVSLCFCPTIVLTTRQNIVPIERFQIDLNEGNVASYTLIEPRMAASANGSCNWQHPECSVLEGERLIKSVYESLRASSVWNDLLFIVNYDEHGGECLVRCTVCGW